MKYQLRILEAQVNSLYSHLFPGDNLEAVSILVCGHHISTSNTVLTVNEIFNVPHEECVRDTNFIHWKTDSIIPILEKAAKNGATILKIHSHPTGYDQFSELDNESDLRLMPSIYGWIDGNNPHGSLVMLPNKTIFGRIVTYDNKFYELNKISIIGDTLEIFQSCKSKTNQNITLRNAQTFGTGTTELLKSLKIGVVGASGTGSSLIEQLVRLGVGEIVIIDPDIVEEKNLNRIINATIKDCEEQRFKVDVLKDMIHKIGFSTEVKTFNQNIYDSRIAIRELILCDFIFGCVDSVDGRHLINQISTFYLIPYIDLGVKLDADGEGGISQINGAVHYIKPGEGSLMSRGVYDKEALESANLYRQNPLEFMERLKEKYIKNVNVNSPAVISINMLVSSYAVNEFLDRIHHFMSSDPIERAITWISITEGMVFTESDNTVDNYLLKKLGKGDCRPFLEMSEL